MFDDFFARKLLRKLITAAVERLYSGNCDMDDLARELSQSREDLALIRSYICIQTAAQLTEPLKASDVDAAFQTLRASEKHLDMPEFAEILDIHRELAEHFWMRKCATEEEESSEVEARISTLQRRMDSLLEGV